MNILTPYGYKHITSCSIGDEVVAYDINDGHIFNNVIENIEQWDINNDSEFTSSFYLVNGAYTLYKNQSIWANMNVKHVGLLKIGDTIYDDQDGDVTITNIVPTTPDSVWYRLEISGDHSYIADGLTLHNASRFWVSGAGTWNASNTTNWASTTGGAGGASVPGSADTVTIDANSGTGSITVDGNFSITSLTCGAMNMTLDFSTNNNDITMSTFAGGGSGTRTINMGNGTWTITGTTATFFGTSTNLTLNTGNSNILFTNTTNSNVTLTLTQNLTLNKVTYNRGASTGTNVIALATTPTSIRTFIDNGTAAHSIQFQQIRTYNIGNFIVKGSAGNLISIIANGSNAATVNKSPLGIVNTDYISGSGAAPVNVTPTNTWYIGTNSTAPGTGWVTTNYPARDMGISGVG